METEKRLIDANALGIGRCNPDAFPFENRAYCAGWNGVIGLIESAPTVDAVEVVRCKDCRHFQQDTLSCDFLNHRGSFYNPNWYEDDFCSYGERKDND